MMAWTTVTYACGHTSREQLYGKYTDRASYVEWARRSKLCAECYRAKRDAEPPEAHLRPVYGRRAVEIYILNSYQAKDLLKARGYCFGEYSRPDRGGGLLGPVPNAVGQIPLDTYKGWGRRYSVDSPRECDACIAEVRWIVKQGWPIHIADGPLGDLEVTLAALMEGRPDLLPLPPRKE